MLRAILLEKLSGVEKIESKGDSCKLFIPLIIAEKDSVVVRSIFTCGSNSVLLKLDDTANMSIFCEISFPPKAAIKFFHRSFLQKKGDRVLQDKGRRQVCKRKNE